MASWPQPFLEAWSWTERNFDRNHSTLSGTSGHDNGSARGSRIAAIWVFMAVYMDKE